MTRCKLVGILNVTPDSFSDGGAYRDADAALRALRKLAEEGADVIDIGAESTRPGATPLSQEQEWERLAPLLPRALALGIPISIDTRHALTARHALDMGAAWINDVSGFANPDMIEAVAASDCMLVMMHSLSVPSDKQIVLPQSADVMAELIQFAHTRVGYMEAAGIAQERIIFDPGLGFGKTAKQSWEIVERIAELRVLNMPLYVGHSRKSFLKPSPLEGEGWVGGASPLTSERGVPPTPALPLKGGGSMERDLPTLAVSKQLAAAGVEYLRVHNVKLHREAL